MRPFSSGSQFGDWLRRNCDRCTKGAMQTGPDTWPECEIEAALIEAYVSDGQVDDEIAERMGYRSREYTWACTEWSPTKETLGEGDPWRFVTEDASL